VARPRFQAAVLRIPDIAAEVTARGKAYGYELLSRRRRAPTREEAAAGLAGPLLALACRHLADARPLAHEARVISVAAVPEAEAIDFGSVAPGSWLIGHVPWTEAEHRIAAEGAAGAVAAALGLARGAACLVVERRTWRRGEAVTRVRQSFRGDMYHLLARFAPGGEGWPSGDPADRMGSPDR